MGGSGGAGGGGWWVEVSRTVGGLASHARYEFWVSASTRVGEGAVSRVVSQRPAQDKQGTKNRKILSTFPNCVLL